jgi:hypothetical protein
MSKPQRQKKMQQLVDRWCNGDMPKMEEFRGLLPDEARRVAARLQSPEPAAQGGGLK